MEFYSFIFSYRVVGWLVCKELSTETLQKRIGWCCENSDLRDKSELKQSKILSCQSSCSMLDISVLGSDSVSSRPGEVRHTSETRLSFRTNLVVGVRSEVHKCVQKMYKCLISGETLIGKPAGSS